MTEPAFLLTADESAIVMREHEGRWYAVRLLAGTVGNFEYLNIFPRPTPLQVKFLSDSFNPIGGAFFDSISPGAILSGFVFRNPTLNDYGVSNLSTLA